MRNINILVLGVGGNVSQGILTAIKSCNMPCRIVGACISEESLGLYFCDVAYISPYANDPNFVDWVADICNKERIDIVFSGVEENVMALESGREKFESQTKALFVSCNKEQLEIGQNKYKTAIWLKQHGCNYPKSANISHSEEVEQLIEEAGFPLLAKPNSGKGAHGIFKVHSREELESIQGKDYCLQEIIGNENEEYTVACYMDKNGQMQDSLIMHRSLKYGTTFMSEIVQDAAIKEECNKICMEFKPQGPLNVQLRIHQGRPVCFELNVRFSGTTPIRAMWGYNDVEAMIREYLFDEPVSLHPQKEGKAYRYYNEAFIDVNMQHKLKEHGCVGSVNNFHNYINKK